VIAVDLGRRRDQHTLAEASAVIEHVLRTVEVGDDRVNGLLDDQPRTDCGRKVVDDVGLIDQLVHHCRREDGVHDEVEMGVVPEMSDVLLPARRQVVERKNLPTFV